MIELHIKGMHCSACVEKIEQALYQLEGVTKAVAKLDKNKAIEAIAKPAEMASPEANQEISTEEAGRRSEA